MKRMRTIISIIIVIVLSGCFYGYGCGESQAVLVTTELLMPDGTVKSVSDAPLPVNLRIQMTFTEAVTPAEVEAAFNLTDGRGLNVPNNKTWNADNTVMIVKPHNRLETDTTYTIGLTEVQLSSSAQVSMEKALIPALQETFRTFTRNDVNGDGLADLVVPAPGWDSGGNNGRGYLFYAANLVSKNAADADAKIDGVAGGDQVRFQLSDDVNDDGYADMIGFSILSSGSAGAIYIFYGGAGTPVTGNLRADDADVVYTGAAGNSFFFLPRVGDLNGDGYTDIIVGAWGTSANAGSVHIFFGPNFTSGNADTADVIITGMSANDAFGSRVVAGDINGDGVADALCSATGYDGIGGGGNKGRAYIFYGGSELASTNADAADVIITGETDGDMFELRGWADFDDDGVLDLFGDARGWSGGRGRAYVFYGANLASKNADAADVIFDGEAAPSADFGFVVLSDEVTGDTLPDLLVSTFQYNTNQGAIYVFEGGSGFVSKDAADADVRITGEAAGDFFALNTLGDVNGDGIDDLAASSTANGGGTGRAYFFFGGTGLSSRGAINADAYITGENTNDKLGVGNLWDFNGDDVMDIYLNAAGFDGTGVAVPANTGRAYVFYGGSGFATQAAAAASVFITGESAGDFF